MNYARERQIEREREREKERGSERERERSPTTPFFARRSQAGTGTDPQQGAALARAMLEADRRPRARSSVAGETVQDRLVRSVPR